MKTIPSFLLLLAALLLASTALAQRPVVCVLDVNAEGVPFEPTALGNLVRIEVEKLDSFEVIDRFDVSYLAKKYELQTAGCYGKICLVEIGKKIGADFIITGSVEQYTEKINVTMRLVDVKKEIVLRTHVREFLDLEQQVPAMLSVATLELLGRKPSEALINSLTKDPGHTENALEVGRIPSLKLNGIRTGGVLLTGEAADIMALPSSQGGYDMALPVMYQMGYQFEKSYINEGNFQALFEFIPMVTGVERGLFIPSITVLNGARLNRSGWEFAFGPTFNLGKTAEGYYDANNLWQLRHADSSYAAGTVFRQRLDSRGEYALNTGFVLGFGKTFISGRVNFPVNVFVIPNRASTRVGISVGYNARKR